MVKLERKKAPDFLQANKQNWTELFVNGAVFTWHNKQAEILECLKAMSLNHCAFCDDLLFPHVGEKGEIEHFRPKEKYKKYAYAWANLYPICRRCNAAKGERFDKLLLRPDRKGYEFSDWFRLDPNTFELKPKKLGNPNWEIAAKTIELYGLSKEDKNARRQYEFDKIQKGEYDKVENRPFRFLNF